MSNEKAVPAEPSSADEVRGKFVFLFVFLLIELVLYPYAGDYGIRSQWFRLLSLLITVASIYAVSFRRFTWILALLFAIPVALHRAVLMERTTNNLELGALVLGVLFDVFIVVVIFRRVFRVKVVNSEAIFGAVSIYLMVGFAFTRIYLFLVALQPTAFYLDPVLNRHALPGYSDLIFYSFATMTSLGADGISPVTSQARSLSIIEAILGILYLGVLVSRLIAMYRPPASSVKQT